MSNHNWWDLEENEQGYNVEVRMCANGFLVWRKVQPSGNSAPHVFNHEAALSYIKTQNTQKLSPGGYRAVKATEPVT